MPNQNAHAIANILKNIFDKKGEYDPISVFSAAMDTIKEHYIDELSEKDLTEKALAGLLSSLDSHSTFLDKKALNDTTMALSGEFTGIGVEMVLTNGALQVIPYEGTPAYRAGIRAGDKIIMINGSPVSELTFQEAVDQVRGKVGTYVNIVVSRDGCDKNLDFSIPREEIIIRPVFGELIGNKDIVYLKIDLFNEHTAHALRDTFLYLIEEIEGDNNPPDSSNTPKGMILDLRNNPGGLLDEALNVSDLFLQSAQIVSTRGRSTESNKEFYATDSEDVSDGLPIIVLINSGTASAPEIVSGALQDNRRAIILGTRSFGKGTVQTVIPIAGDSSAICLTTALYYTPSGRSIQAEGITPDIVVEDINIPSDVSGVKKSYESDLPHHLAPRDISGVQSSGERQKKRAKRHDNKEDSLKAQGPAYMDFQLTRAVDLLLGVSLYGGVMLNK